MGVTLVFVFAVLLCLVNALVWTFVADFPMMGIGWALAAGFCFQLQRWSRK